MRKLFITCDCGQQMQVPRSAIGKMGQCPSCGEKIPINRDTTATSPQARPSIGAASRKKWGTRVKPNVDAKQQFGRAVDLYCEGRYGEALAIFDALQAEFPDSAEIQRARRQCMEARNRDPINLPEPSEGQVAGDELNEATLRALRRIVVAKMLHGSTEGVQLRAAELVARMAGVLRPEGSVAGGAAKTEAGLAESELPPENGERPANPGGNGHVRAADTPAPDVVEEALRHGQGG